MRTHENHSVVARRARLTLLLGIAAVATLTACGKKGPLYLPAEADAPKPTAPAPTAPAVPEKGAGVEEGAHQK